MIGIYKITNKINGKCYIGQSVDIKRRFMEHKAPSHQTNMTIKKAIKKYGVDNFTFEVLEACSVEKLNEREIYWINKLKPKYNRSEGGLGARGHFVTDELREELKKIGKRQWANMSEEKRRDIIKNNLTGPKTKHKVSKHTREKLRNANLGKKQSTYTIEKRKKTIILKKQNGYIQTNAGHRKKVICIETGMIFNSVKEAGEYMGAHPSSVSGVVKGRYQTCKGFHFKYYSVETNRDECNGVGEI